MKSRSLKSIKHGKERSTAVLCKITVGTVLMALAVMAVGCSNENKSNEGNMKTDEIVLTDSNFDAETSKGVVLVDFWAPWCGPCRMQGPVVEKVAAGMAGRAKVGKCNVDEAPKSAERYGIRSIPTLVILKDGKEVERFVGVQSEAHLTGALKEHVGKSQ